MRIFPASALAAAVLLLALPAIPHRAEANTGVLRCRMPDGTSAYGNRACSDLGATAAPLSADVLNRIASEQRREARASGVDDDAIAALSTSNPFSGIRRKAPGGCATSPAQLGLELQSSLAMGDVNRVAESFDWTGMRHAQARPIMDRLGRMASRDRIVDAEFFQAERGGPRDAGLMHITFASDGITRVDDYAVSTNSGCYFLRLVLSAARTSTPLVARVGCAHASPCPAPVVASRLPARAG